MRAFNTRILIIDDEETIRDSFREILLPRKRDSASLEKAGADLFGEDTCPLKPSGSMFDFELQEAANGHDGLELVRKAVSEKRPFAAIFVDMRMPGWDGLKTVQHIRKLDERAEIIFVTAYSDYSIEEVVEKAGVSVSYHCKPFSVEEIRQIATKAIYEWNKARNLEELIEIISHLRTRQWQSEPLLNNILYQVSAMVGSVSAVLAKCLKNGRYKKMTGTGKLADDAFAQKYLNEIPELIDKNIWQSDHFAYFRIEKYGILALFENNDKPLNTERLYIVRLFLEHAAQAIANVELQETLLRKEKLSAVGEAMSMLVHDLRGPIGNICQGIELLETTSDDEEFVRNMYRLLMSDAKKSLRMVNDVLDFTRNSPLLKEQIDLTLLIGSVVKSTEDFLKKSGITLRTDMSQPFYFPADENKIERTLINLIRNAAESFVKSEISDPVITLSAQAVSDGFQFIVEDNGPGIPDDIYENLFVPFATQNKKGGTGLGLAIAKQFVEAHGGTIRVDTGSEGTKFIIFLPDK